MTVPRDVFGREWPELEGYEDIELCPECGQPDNCGDCNHQPFTDQEALRLGATLPAKS